MTISVNYAASQGSTTIAQYLVDWTAGFQTAGHGYSNTGGFSSGGRNMNGDQYATHGGNGSDYAFIADSNTTNGLHYVFTPGVPASSNMNHYLWGNLDNVQLGEVLGGGNGQDFSLDNYVVAFNGLDLSAAQGVGRVGNVVQDVIYGLMQGNTANLETVLNNLLDDYGLSTASTFDALAAKGLGHATAESFAAADVALVGVQDIGQDWALAA